MGLCGDVDLGVDATVSAAVDPRRALLLSRVLLASCVSACSSGCSAVLLANDASDYLHEHTHLISTIEWTDERFSVNGTIQLLN